MLFSCFCTPQISVSVFCNWILTVSHSSANALCPRVEIFPEAVASLAGKESEELDGVPRTQTSRLLLSYYNYTAVEATALLFVQQHVKGAIIVYHVTPPHGRKWPLYRMIVRELRQ